MFYKLGIQRIWNTVDNIWMSHKDERINIYSQEKKNYFLRCETEKDEWEKLANKFCRKHFHS